MAISQVHEKSFYSQSTFKALFAFAPLRCIACSSFDPGSPMLKTSFQTFVLKDIPKKVRSTKLSNYRNIYKTSRSSFIMHDSFIRISIFMLTQKRHQHFFHDRSRSRNSPLLLWRPEWKSETISIQSEEVSLFYFLVSWRLKTTNWFKNVAHLQLRTQKKGFCAIFMLCSCIYKTINMLHNSLLRDFPGLFGGHHRLGVDNSVEGNIGDRAVSVRKLQVPCCWKRGSHSSAFMKILLSVKTGHHHEWFIQMWFWDWFVGEFAVETVCCRCQWSWTRCHRLAFLP